MVNKAATSQRVRKRSSLKAGYLVRIDDVAANMNWDAYFRAKSLFDEYGVRPLLGVIPENRDPDLLKFQSCDFDFWEEIRSVQSRGWEIAIHGYRHVYDSLGRDLLGMGDRSEFAGHDYEVQLDRLRRARAIFDRERVAVDVFFAPSHTFDENTIRALAEIGVTSICDGYGLFPFHDRGMLFVPQLVGRPIAVPFGVHTSVHHLNHFTEADFSALERFLSQNRERMISYAEARELAEDRLWNHACGAVLKKALQAKRRLGRLLEGSGHRGAVASTPD